MICKLGWNDPINNMRGRCCCNCIHQKQITAHPWNEGAFKGPVTQVIGYGCTLPELESINFMSRKHAMCECHEFDHGK